MSINNIYEIKNFLEELNYPSFLTSNIDILSYSAKLFQNAEIKCKRDNHGALKALIAYYANDSSRENAFISLIAVSPIYRGEGLAYLLLKNCISDLKQKKFKEITLDVQFENHKAISLYSKFGFKEVDRNGESIKMSKTL